MNLAEYRKAIAAGAGVMLTGLLDYVVQTQPQLVAELQHVLPAPLVFAAPIVVGGIATIAAVIKAENAQPVTIRRTPAATSDRSLLSASSPASPTIDVSARPASPNDPVSAGVPALAGTTPTAAGVATPASPEETAPAAAAAVSTSGPFWAGVTPGEPQASTSIVQLQPVPSPSYQ